MNPYANLYLQVHKQHQQDLARTYKHAQRGWAHPDFPNQSEYRPVRKSRVAAAWRRLGRRQSRSPVSQSARSARSARSLGQRERCRRPGRSAHAA